MVATRKSIIVAVDKDWGFGRDGTIPWTNREDMQHFRAVTAGATVVMGYNTCRSIGKPLPNRHNVIICDRNRDLIPQSTDTTPVTVYSSNDEFFANVREDAGDIVIIGGYTLYRDALLSGWADSLFITFIDGRYDCDRKFDAQMIAAVDGYFNVLLKPISGGIITRYDRKRTNQDA